MRRYATSEVVGHEFGRIDREGRATSCWPRRQDARRLRFLSRTAIHGSELRKVGPVGDSEALYWAWSVSPLQRVSDAAMAADLAWSCWAGGARL